MVPLQFKKTTEAPVARIFCTIARFHKGLVKMETTAMKVMSMCVYKGERWGAGMWVGVVGEWGIG